MVMVLATLAQGADFPTPTLAEVNPAGIRGSLVFCGGGQLPDAAVSEFLELAGGENARLAVVPAAA